MEKEEEKQLSKLEKMLLKVVTNKVFSNANIYGGVFFVGYGLAIENWQAMTAGIFCTLIGSSRYLFN